MDICEKQARNKMSRIARKYNHSGYKSKQYYTARLEYMFYKSEKQRKIYEAQQNGNTSNLKKLPERHVHKWVDSFSKLKLWNKLRKQHPNELNQGLIPQIDLTDNISTINEQKVYKIISNRHEYETGQDGNCLFYSLLGYSVDELTQEVIDQVKEYRVRIATFIQSYPQELINNWESILSDIQDERSRFQDDEWDQVQQVLHKCSGVGTLEGDELKWVQQRLCDLYSIILKRGNTFGAGVVMLAFSIMENKPVMVVQQYPGSNKLKLISIYPSETVFDSKNLAFKNIIVVNRVMVPRDHGQRPVEHYRFFA